MCVFIPLEKINVVSDKPPIHRPTPPSMQMLGTKSLFAEQLIISNMENTEMFKHYACTEQKNEKKLVRVIVGMKSSVV